MSELTQKVMQYFTYADNGEVEKVESLFSEDAVYKRCEDVFLGRPEIVAFYTKKRNIKGKHTILKMHEDENTVIVRGIFDGEDGKGNPLRVFFSDFFTFNPDKLIFTRETYLAKGAECIQ